MSSAAMLLDKTLTHQRATVGQDAIGGRSVTSWSNVAASVACAVWPATPKTVQQFQRVDVLVEHEVATAVNLAARIGDRLLIGSIYYTVVGRQEYENAMVGSPSVYVTVCGRLNQ